MESTTFSQKVAMLDLPHFIHITLQDLLPENAIFHRHEKTIFHIKTNRSISKKNTKVKQIIHLKFEHNVIDALQTAFNNDASSLLLTYANSLRKVVKERMIAYEANEFEHSDFVIYVDANAIDL